MQNKDPVRYHAFIEGRVQGVGFRMFVKECADLMNLTGWVRNTWQGEVEVMVEGSQATVQQLILKLQQGTSQSLVSNLRSSWETPTGEFSRFSVRRTE